MVYGDAAPCNNPAATLHWARPEPEIALLLPFEQLTVLWLWPVIVKRTVPVGMSAFCVTGTDTWALIVMGFPVAVWVGVAVKAVAVPVPDALATRGTTANDVMAITTLAPAAAATFLPRPLNIFPPPDECARRSGRISKV